MSAVVGLLWSTMLGYGGSELAGWRWDVLELVGKGGMVDAVRFVV